MTTLVALYQKPQNAAAFDDHYFSRHVPLAKTIPGLRRYTVNDGAINSAAGPSKLHLVALLTFDSMAALQQALASPEGQAATADLGHFAQAGVELLVFDTREV